MYFAPPVQKILIRVSTETNVSATAASTGQRANLSTAAARVSKESRPRSSFMHNRGCWLYSIMHNSYE